MADQSRLHLRLFLEGIEVSVINATVSSTAGSHSQATIQVIYTPSVMELLPRTLVHLFFYDSTPAEDGEYYRLLFCGDLTSVTVTKTESNRTATLICSDHREYYNHAFLHLLNTVDLEGPNTTRTLLRNRQLFSQAGSSTYVGEAQSIESVISQIFKDGRPTYPGYSNLRGALGGIIKSMEMFTGLTAQGNSGVNTFFAYNVARLNLLGQIGMYSNDFTSQKILLSKQMQTLLGQKGQQLGDLISLNTLIEFILGFIYHRSVPNPCALYKGREVRDDNRIDLSVKSLKKFRASCKELSDILTEAIKSANKRKIELERIIRDDEGLGFKPDEPVVLGLQEDKVGDLIINTVSSLFPSDLLVDLATNPYVAEGPTAKFIKSTITGSSAKAFTSREGSPTVEVIFSIINEASEAKDKALLLKVGEALKYMLSSAEQIVIDRNNGRAPRTSEYISTIEKAGTLIKSMAEDQELKYSSLSTPRLYTSLVVPDLFFSVAPTCNIVFPDQYFTSSYTRNISREVSRLQLELIDNLTNASVASRFFYAPATEPITGLQGKVLSEDNTALTKNLMDHELYGGILPEFTSVLRMNLQEITSDPDLNEEGFYSTIANYRFLQQRLAQRQLSISGKFNPYAVAGFPLVLVDTPEPKSNHYIGLLTALTHSVTQQGGTTSYQVQYARPYNSRDDAYSKTFGVNKVVKRQVESFAISTDTIIKQLEKNFIEGTDYANQLAALRFIARCSDEAGGAGGFVKGRKFHEFVSDFVKTEKVPVELLNKLGVGTELSIDSVKSVNVGDASALGGNKYLFSNDFYKSEHTLKEIAERFASFVSPSPEKIQEIEEAIRAGLLPANATETLTGREVFRRLLKEYIDPIFKKYEKYLAPIFTDNPVAFSRLFDAKSKIISALGKLVTRKEHGLEENTIRIALAIQDMAKDIVFGDDITAAVLFIASAGVPHRSPIQIVKELNIDVNTVTTEFLEFPIEEAMKPGFIHPAYSSPTIGDNVYKELIGIGSIIDEVKKGDSDVAEEAFFSIETKLESGVEASSVVSQEVAIETIVKRYAASAYGPTFVDEMTRRPIATLNQVLTDPEEGFHYKGYADSVTEDKEIPLLGFAFKVEEGEELPDNVRELSAAEEQALKDDKVDDRVDVREARSKAVTKYVNSLQNRGLRG